MIQIPYHIFHEFAEGMEGWGVRSLKGSEKRKKKNNQHDQTSKTPPLFPLSPLYKIKFNFPKAISSCFVSLPPPHPALKHQLANNRGNRYIEVCLTSLIKWVDSA